MEPREPFEKTSRQLSPIHGLESDFGVDKKRFCLQARVRESPQGSREFRFPLRCRRPNAPLFDNHRRQHAGPVAIVSKRLEKLAVALILGVFQATPDPDLGVIVRALRLITLGTHRPQMHFDESAIWNRESVGPSRIGFLRA